MPMVPHSRAELQPLADFLRTTRAQQGLHRPEVAARVQVQDGKPLSPETLRNIERGYTRPSWGVLTQLAQIYGCPIERLVVLDGSLLLLLQYLRHEAPELVQSLRALVAFFFRKFF